MKGRHTFPVAVQETWQSRKSGSRLGHLLVTCPNMLLGLRGLGESIDGMSCAWELVPFVPLTVHWKKCPQLPISSVWLATPLSDTSLHHPISPKVATRAQTLTSYTQESEDETALHGGPRSHQEQTSWIKLEMIPTFSLSVPVKNNLGRDRH